MHEAAPRIQLLRSGADAGSQEQDESQEAAVRDDHTRLPLDIKSDCMACRKALAEQLCRASL